MASWRPWRARSPIHGGAETPLESELFGELMAGIDHLIWKDEVLAHRAVSRQRTSRRPGRRTAVRRCAKASRRRAATTSRDDGAPEEPHDPSYEAARSEDWDNVRAWRALDAETRAARLRSLREILGLGGER